MTPYFQYEPRVSLDACLVQIWCFKLKSATSYSADKVKITDGQTDGRTDVGNDNTPSDQGVKMKQHKQGAVMILI